MKDIYINNLIVLVRKFAAAADLYNDRKTIAVEMEATKELLNEKYGMDWDEIESIEINILSQC